jgi:hypothetical protein
MNNRTNATGKPLCLSLREVFPLRRKPQKAEKLLQSSARDYQHDSASDQEKSDYRRVVHQRFFKR